MSLQVQGAVQGKQIELEREIDLPDGTPVTLHIETVSLPLTEKLRLIDQLCGSWAMDASIEPLFAEIERERAAASARNVDFDAPIFTPMFLVAR